MELIKPKQKDEELLEDIRLFESGKDSFKVWWLGQSGFLLKWQGRCILFDPYLSDSLSVKYQYTDKPHMRMSERVVDPGRLDFIDVVTSSHNHTDHLDAETLVPVIGNNEAIHFVIPAANRAFVADRVKCDIDFPLGLNDSESADILGFKFTGIPAAHNLVERNEKGECKFMGFVVEFGNFSVYHSGDTLLFEGLEDILKSFQVDIAFLPINGNKPERKVAGNLNAEEAAALGKEIGAKLIVPHHYHMFEFNTAEPALFASHCDSLGMNYKVMELGEGLEYS